MKKYFLTICCIILALSAPSCKKGLSNFLDQAPGVSVNEDVIFSSKAQLEIFVATMYKYGVYPIVAYRDASLSTTKTVDAVVIPFGMTASDEGEAAVNFSQSNAFYNPGIVNSSNILKAEDTRFYQRFISISQCNIIIERAHELIGKDPAASQLYVNQVIGEAKFIRALNYMEMIKRYGGVPIIKKRFNPGDDINIPRGTFEDCVNFIVSDCNDAGSSGLPGTQPAALTGRATTVAAAALKSKALLFAASPLFNTANPVISLGANNKLICYGNYDVTRWGTAAQAAKDALDSCAKYGYVLIDNPTNRDPRYNYPNGTPDAQALVSGGGYPLKAGNYKQSWEIPNNSEVIFADMGNGLGRVYTFPFGGIYPKAMNNGGAFNYGVCITQNFVSMYENKNTGLAQAWNGGNDLQTIYDNLDPRFKQSIAFSGNYYNSQNPIVATYASTNGDKTKPGANYDAAACPTQLWLKKLIPDALFNGGAGVTMTWPLLRVNELWLNYAEAVNEATPGQAPQAAYDAINKIRTRSGMPNVPSGLTTDLFRIKVQHERAIELAFEDHRFWDVRRWKIADQPGVMQGQMYAQNINKLTTGGYSYTIIPYETRVFYPYEYLTVFDISEVRKGYLVQNPGW